MISSIPPHQNSIRFQSNRNRAEVDAEDFTEGAAATAGASAIAAGARRVSRRVSRSASKGIETTTKSLKTVNRIAKKSSDMIEALPKNKIKFQGRLLKAIESAEKIKFLRPFAKLAKNPVVVRFAGAFGFFIGFAFLIADLGNIINVSSNLAQNFE